VQVFFKVLCRNTTVVFLLEFSGLVQGMVTGMRGLCNGLGPAMFGVIFYLFHVDLNEVSSPAPYVPGADNSSHTPQVHFRHSEQVFAT
jgi:hypothetical protein